MHICTGSTVYTRYIKEGTWPCACHEQPKHETAETSAETAESDWLLTKCNHAPAWWLVVWWYIILRVPILVYWYTSSTWYTRTHNQVPASIFNLRNSRPRAFHH